MPKNDEDNDDQRAMLNKDCKSFYNLPLFVLLLFLRFAAMVDQKKVTKTV